MQDLYVFWSWSDLWVKGGLNNLIFFIGIQNLKFSSFKWFQKHAKCNLYGIKIVIFSNKLQKIPPAAACPQTPVCNTIELR